jgi:hypothetical protein
VKNGRENEKKKKKKKGPWRPPGGADPCRVFLTAHFLKKSEPSKKILRRVFIFRNAKKNNHQAYRAAVFFCSAKKIPSQHFFFAHTACVQKKKSSQKFCVTNFLFTKIFRAIVPSALQNFCKQKICYAKFFSAQIFFARREKKFACAKFFERSAFKKFCRSFFLLRKKKTTRDISLGPLLTSKMRFLFLLTSKKKNYRNSVAIIFFWLAYARTKGVSL